MKSTLVRRSTIQLIILVLLIHPLVPLGHCAYRARIQQCQTGSGKNIHQRVSSEKRGNDSQKSVNMCLGRNLLMLWILCYMEFGLAVELCYYVLVQWRSNHYFPSTTKGPARSIEYLTIQWVLGNCLATSYQLRSREAFLLGASVSTSDLTLTLWFDKKSHWNTNLKLLDVEFVFASSNRLGITTDMSPAC